MGGNARQQAWVLMGSEAIPCHRGIAKAESSRFRLSPEPGPLPFIDIHFKTFPVGASPHCWWRAPSQGMGGRKKGAAGLLCRDHPAVSCGSRPAGAPPGETPHCTPAFAVVLISQAHVWSRFQLCNSVLGTGNSELSPVPRTPSPWGYGLVQLTGTDWPLMGVCPRG